MPVIPQKIVQVLGSPSADADTTPERLRPYTFHGVFLTVRGKHAIGDCPFCGREGKFSVDVESGLWRCFVCSTGTDRGGGNAHVFLKLLWDRSDAATNGSSKQLAKDRGFSDPATVTAWGVCQSILDKVWLVPGYGPDGKFRQLYRRIRTWDKTRWTHRLLPTPGVWPEGQSHALHMPSMTFDPAKGNVWVTEGPWDGMVLWEIARQTKHVEGSIYEMTGAESSSILSDTNVVAAPGCWGIADYWLPIFRDKHVTLWYDSDHPRITNGKTFRAGFDGMYRVSKTLSGIAKSIRWLRWGKDGYDPDKPSGYDVRDHITGSKDRRLALSELLSKVEPVPADWTITSTDGARSAPGISPERCDNWRKCESAWMDALEWRGGLGDVLAVMLAVATSTVQSGDNQLFFQVIGDPGSAKTRLCKGLLVSRRCKLILHIKSFHSGFKKPGDGDKDCSLVARINGLCLVTPEADALMLGMSYDELNSQMRQIFDGETQNTYGNSDEDRGYKGLRTPWIQAGTPALMDKDQSRLGDRFMRIRIDEPDDDTKRSIMLKAIRNERQAVIETSNGTESSIVPPKLRKAYALTGGYVDWLRDNVETLISQVDMNEESEVKCINLAMLTADLRARPNMDTRKHEVHHSKELPSRLACQFTRLAMCLAVVLNKRFVDDDVMRIVRKVAFDTAHGHSLNIVRWLCSENPKTGLMYHHSGGLMMNVLEQWTGMTEEKLFNYLNFLRKIDVLEHAPVRNSWGFWKLTDRVYELYTNVMGD